MAPAHPKPLLRVKSLKSKVTKQETLAWSHLSQDAPRAANSKMLELADQIDEAAMVIRDRWPLTPKVGIVLGSGLGNFVKNIETHANIPYIDIPHFVKPTAIGHTGALICGTVQSVPVIAMQGRYHLYEGHSPTHATLPIRVLKQLGIELLILSNAAGGLNPQYQQGDVMLIDDQINLMFRNPLFGINDDTLGPRFPDMSQPYAFAWLNRAQQIGVEKNLIVHRGVYAALSGPTYETRAEYRMLRTLGADVVGMSTVPETIAAVHAGIPVLGLSVITNVCKPDALGETSGEKVVATAKDAEPQLRTLVLGILHDFTKNPH